MRILSELLARAEGKKKRKKKGKIVPNEFHQPSNSLLRPALFCPTEAGPSRSLPPLFPPSLPDQTAIQLPFHRKIPGFTKEPHKQTSRRPIARQTVESTDLARNSTSCLESSGVSDDDLFYPPLIATRKCHVFRGQQPRRERTTLQAAAPAHNPEMKEFICKTSRTRFHAD